MMTPKYVPLVRRQPVHTRTVRKWTQGAAEALQDCFESIDWDVLCEPHGEDIDNMTDCITDYIRFCEDTTMPARTVHCFSNNKPWITSDLKALLKKKRWLSGLETERSRGECNVKEEAGGQTPAEQCERCVDRNEAHHGDEGEKQADIREPLPPL